MSSPEPEPPITVAPLPTDTKETFPEKTIRLLPPWITVGGTWNLGTFTVRVLPER